MYELGKVRRVWNGKKREHWAVSRLREKGSWIKRELKQRAGNTPKIREV